LEQSWAYVGLEGANYGHESRMDLTGQEMLRASP
jgi:hypothetical protein